MLSDPEIRAEVRELEAAARRLDELLVRLAHAGVDVRVRHEAVPAHTGTDAGVVTLNHVRVTAFQRIRGTP